MGRAGNSSDDEHPNDLDILTPADKLYEGKVLCKATILSKATEYICRLEKDNKRLEGEIASLNARVNAYDKMSMTVYTIRLASLTMHLLNLTVGIPLHPRLATF